MPLRSLPRPHPEAVRFIPFFMGINFIGGVNLPFFPAWLESRGFTPESIGLLMMVMGFVRVVTVPALGFAADAYAARRLAIIVLTGVATLAYSGFAVVPAAAAIVVCSIVSSSAISAVGPLIEGVTLKTALLHRFDYGRVRSFGSAAFIVMNFASGVILAQADISDFLVLLIGSSLLACVMSLLLPVEAAPEQPHEKGHVWRDVKVLVRQPAFVVFLIAAGLAQSCHAFYYGFGTLNWKALGYSPALIGFLWGLGVVAEIVLFTFSNRVVHRVGPVGLMVIGTACGLVRWTVTAFSPPLWVLLPIQCLHAGTFGAAHLGAMHFIARAVPGHLVGTAQSIYSAVTVGVFMACGQYASGHLFADHGAYGYLLMTAVSVLAMGCSALLGRVWHGGALNARA